MSLHFVNVSCFGYVAKCMWNTKLDVDVQDISFIKLRYISGNCKMYISDCCVYGFYCPVRTSASVPLFVGDMTCLFYFYFFISFKRHANLFFKLFVFLKMFILNISHYSNKRLNMFLFVSMCM